MFDPSCLLVKLELKKKNLLLVKNTFCSIIGNLLPQENVIIIVIAEIDCFEEWIKLKKKKKKVENCEDLYYEHIVWSPR